MKDLQILLLFLILLILSACIHPPASISQYSASQDLEVDQKQRLISQLKANARQAARPLPGSVGVLTFSEGEPQTGLGLAATEFFTSNLALFERFELIDLSYSAALEAEFANYSPDRKRVMLQAEQLVAGRVSIEDKQLKIRSDHLPQNSNRPTELANISGNVTDFFRLIADLNIKFLENNDIPVTQNMAKKLYEVPTQDIIAYILYARGRNHERLGNYKEALEAYQAAAKKDPKFKEAKKKEAEAERKLQNVTQETETKNVLTDVPDTSPNIIEETAVPGVVGNSTVIIDFVLPE